MLPLYHFKSDVKMFIHIFVTLHKTSNNTGDNVRSLSKELDEGNLCLLAINILLNNNIYNVVLHAAGKST